MYTELIHLCYGKYFLGVSCRKIFIATYKPQIYNKKMTIILAPIITQQGNVCAK